MLCRVADDLFWIGRYVERAISVSRLVEVTQHLALDAGGSDFWAPLVADAARRGDADIEYHLAFDERNENSLVSSVAHARAIARGVRESISSEMWEELNTLHFWLASPEARHVRSTFHREARARLQHVQGLADATLAHDEPWQFLSLGTYLQRADGVTRLLRQQVHLLGPGSDAEDTSVRCLAVLRSCGSAEAYARYYTLAVEPKRLVEFLLLNAVFPQAVRFSLNTAHDLLRSIADRRAAAGNARGPAIRTLADVRHFVGRSTIDEVFEYGLEPFLDSVQNAIAAVVAELTDTYLRSQPRPPQLAGVGPGDGALQQ